MMQTDRISLLYELKFTSAFHCGSGLANGPIDRAVVRDNEEYLYLPGSTIKGVLRENCERIVMLYGLTSRDPHDERAAVNALLQGPDIVERIFGSRFYKSSLFFDNAYMTKESKKLFDGTKKNDKRYLGMQFETRTQTRISRRTRTVQKGALFTSEFGIPALTFTGKIHGIVQGVPNDLSELSGPFPLFVLVAGCYLTDRIGANRSTGMGSCKFIINELSVNENTCDPEQYCQELDTFICYKDAKEEQT